MQPSQLNGIAPVVSATEAIRLNDPKPINSIVTPTIGGVKSAKILSKPTGMESLRWLADRGAHFCKVTAWDSTQPSPGKKAIGEGWQNEPYTFDQVLPHINSGKNVGLLCGKHSGFCILDIDENYSGFIARFPDFAPVPTIVRDGADKGKILIKVTDTAPETHRWRHPGDRSPFIEWLATGAQGVIPPSRHPEGMYYRLINTENGIASLECQTLNAILKEWTGTGFETETKATPPSKPAAVPFPSDHSTLRDKVRAALNPLAVFTHFGMVHETQTEGEWVRLKGNGGLFVHENGATWSFVADGKGAGGDAFDAWWYCKSGEYKAPRDTRFHDLLVEMAGVAGIQVSTPAPIPEPPPDYTEDEHNGMEPPMSLERLQSLQEQVQAPPEGGGRIVVLPTGITDPWESSARTLADAYKPRPTIEYVVGGIIEQGSLNIMYGAPGSLKSMVLADMCVCVASGTDWLEPAPWKPVANGYATSPRQVMWLDFDNGIRRTDERFEALARARDLPDTTPIRYYSMPNPWLNASDSVQMGMLINRIKVSNTGLMVVDNLGVIKGGADENSDDMTAVMSLFRQVVEETGTAIIIIHHERKTVGVKTRRGESMRGHSSIEASLDLVLQVEREQGSDTVTIQSTKTRGVEVLPLSAAFTYEHKDNTKELKTARFYGLPGEDNHSDHAVESTIKNCAREPVNKTTLVKEVREQMPDIGINRIRDLIDGLYFNKELTKVQGSRTEQLYQTAGTHE